MFDLISRKRKPRESRTGGRLKLRRFLRRPAAGGGSYSSSVNLHVKALDARSVQQLVNDPVVGRALAKAVARHAEGGRISLPMSSERTARSAGACDSSATPTIASAVKRSVVGRIVRSKLKRSLEKVRMKAHETA